LAVEIAKRFNGEVINGDAMQLYAGLPIITNKITPEEQQGIPHHLLGCISLHEQTWVVGTFVRNALAIIEDIRSRGKLPILVGGTHYYTQSLLFRDRLATGRNDLEAPNLVPDTAERWPILNEPTEVLLAELQRVDPVMAERWHPNDRRKIQRSLEIWLQTGKRASEIYAEQRQERDSQSSPPPDGETVSRSSDMRFPALLFWVHADRDALHDRLNKRVDKMLDNGLLDEVQTLSAFARSEADTGNIINETQGAWISIGYKEFLPYAQALADGSSSMQNLEKLKLEAIKRTKISTRQYSKSQIQWIRIKLANALRQANAADSLYLLDSSDVSQFDEHAVKPALSLTAKFLDQNEMPPPASLSPLAAEMLPPKQNYDLSAEPERWTKHHCDVCNVTCVVEQQWQKHIKSKAHRKLVSKQRLEMQTSQNSSERPEIRRSPAATGPQDTLSNLPRT
jgi:tRNA dimethylallyltransferase